MVPTTSGPPRAAPMPTWAPLSLLPKSTATRMTTLSGSAVPAAARIVPTATGPTLRRTPSHSTALGGGGEPLDGVDEPLACHVDDGGTAEQQGDVEHGLSLPRRDRGRTSTRGARRRRISESKVSPARTLPRADPAAGSASAPACRRTGREGYSPSTGTILPDSAIGRDHRGNSVATRIRVQGEEERPRLPALGRRPRRVLVGKVLEAPLELLELLGAQPQAEPGRAQPLQAGGARLLEA